MSQTTMPGVLGVGAVADCGGGRMACWWVGPGAGGVGRTRGGRTAVPSSAWRGCGQAERRVGCVQRCLQEVGVWVGGISQRAALALIKLCYCRWG